MRRDKFYIGTNLKMYKNIDQTIKYLLELESLTNDIDRDKMQLFVIPSYTSLYETKNKIDKSLLTIGAQNAHWESEGQFTGEVSLPMLEETGVERIEIGHSERRHKMGETNAETNKKVSAALDKGFTALLCVGETGEEKKYDMSKEVISAQIKIGLYEVTESQVENLWIAYEPVWAIGTEGVPASKEYAEEIHKFIRELLIELYPNKGSDIPVLYGGSVNNENAPELILMPDIDGLFIGRSAWNADNFNKIIRETYPLFSAKKEGMTTHE